MVTCVAGVQLDDLYGLSVVSDDELDVDEAWKRTDSTWQWADREGEGVEEGPAMFVRQLEEDLAVERGELLRLVEALDEFRSELTARSALDPWPLELVGRSRELYSETIAQIEARTGFSRAEMPAAGHVEDRDAFHLATAAHPIEHLARGLRRLTAWSVVLFALREHLPTAIAASGTSAL